MTTVKAINKKHQSTVNRFIKANARYDQIVDETEDNGGMKQERAYDKAYELFHELPAREQKNIARTINCIGY